MKKIIITVCMLVAVLIFSSDANVYAGPDDDLFMGGDTLGSYSFGYNRRHRNESSTYGGSQQTTQQNTTDKPSAWDNVVNFFKMRPRESTGGKIEGNFGDHVSDYSGTILGNAADSAAPGAGKILNFTADRFKDSHQNFSNACRNGAERIGNSKILSNGFKAFSAVDTAMTLGNTNHEHSSLVWAGGFLKAFGAGTAFVPGLNTTVGFGLGAGSDAFNGRAVANYFNSRTNGLLDAADAFTSYVDNIVYKSFMGKLSVMDIFFGPGKEGSQGALTVPMKDDGVPWYQKLWKSVYSRGRRLWIKIAGPGDYKNAFNNRQNGYFWLCNDCVDEGLDSAFCPHVNQEKK